MLSRKYKGMVGLVGAFIGIMVAVIIVVSVVVPTIEPLISNNNSALDNYSTAKTLINLSPLLISVVLVLALVGIMKLR